MGNARWQRDDGDKAGQCGGDAAGRALKVTARQASLAWLPLMHRVGAHGDRARTELGASALWLSTTMGSSGRRVRTSTSPPM